MEKQSPIKSNEVILSNLKKGMFGTMQGLIIWLILLVFLFKFAWWAWIPLLCICFGFVDQAIEYTIRKRNGLKEEIKITKGATGAWFGFLLVSYIMYMLFGWAWWGLIAMVGTLFGAIYTTIDYFSKMKQSRKNQLSHVAYEAKIPLEEKLPLENLNSQFCPHCGAKLSSNAQFCALCGSQLK